MTLTRLAKGGSYFHFANLFHYRIHNKILDYDWFSARLFVTQSVLDHVGVQLQVFNLNLPVIVSRSNDVSII